MAEIDIVYGKGSLIMANSKDTHIDRISTGHCAIDDVTGSGIPRGRLTEIYAKQSGGKTTLALQCVASAQKAGLIAAYIDLEHTVTDKYSKLLGVNWNELVYHAPQSGEEAFDSLHGMVASGQFGIVVFDSVAAIATKRMIAGKATEEHRAEVARLLGKELAKLNPMLHKSNTAVVFINQLRATMATFPGAKETVTPGGAALKFLASLRIEMECAKTLKEDGEVVGQTNVVTTVKNKCGPAQAKVLVVIRFPKYAADGITLLQPEDEGYEQPGFDQMAEKIERAIENGALSQGGAGYYKLEDGTKIHGLKQLRQYYKDNPDKL